MKQVIKVIDVDGVDYTLSDEEVPYVDIEDVACQIITDGYVLVKAQYKPTVIFVKQIAALRWEEVYNNG